MTIVINTPAGNIGRRVTAQLLAARADVVIISRHPAKVADLVASGARLVEGSIDDAALLDRVFAGAEALFWLTPFAFDQSDYVDWARRIGITAASLARKHGIGRAVLVSSVGAQHETGVGPIGCLPAIERAFAAAVPDVTALRAASFMENFLFDAATIAKQGTIFGPRLADMAIPMVATADIAMKAVAALRAAPRAGFRTVGVEGPEDLAPSRAAEIIAQGIGRPVRYAEVTVEQAKEGMRAAGVPEFAVELMGDLYTGFREGRAVRETPRSAETTTPTSLLAFARAVLKPAVETAARRC